MPAPTRQKIPPAQPAAALAEMRLLRGLDAAARTAIVAGAAHLTAARGACLFRQGAPARRFFLLRQGCVKLTQVTPDGQLVLLRFVVPGEAFAGVGALPNRAYPVSAEAASNVVLLVWDTRAMDGLLRRHPQLALNLIDLFAERLHDMQARYVELSTESVERRLARMLLRLVRRIGRRVDAGTLVDARLSRQDLAEMTGSSLFTVSRILNRWVQAGIVLAQRQRILVRRPEALLAVAEGPPAPAF